MPYWLEEWRKLRSKRAEGHGGVDDAAIHWLRPPGLPHARPDGRIGSGTFAYDRVPRGATQQISFAVATGCWRGADIDGEGNILFGDDLRSRPCNAIAGAGPCEPDPGVRTCTEAERASAAVPQDGSTTAVVLQLFVEFMLVRGDGELVAADGDFGAEEPSQIMQLHHVETRMTACLRSPVCTLYGVSALMRCVYACKSYLDCAYH